jgi:hypothetical protein
VLNWLFNNIGDGSSRELVFLFRYLRELICRHIPPIPDISSCSSCYMLLQPRLAVSRVELTRLLDDRDRGFDGSRIVMTQRFALSYATRPTAALSASSSTFHVPSPRSSFYKKISFCMCMCMCIYICLGFVWGIWDVFSLLFAYLFYHSFISSFGSSWPYSLLSLLLPI